MKSTNGAGEKRGPRICQRALCAIHRRPGLSCRIGSPQSPLARFEGVPWRLGEMLVLVDLVRAFHLVEAALEQLSQRRDRIGGVRTIGLNH